MNGHLANCEVAEKLSDTCTCGASRHKSEMQARLAGLKFDNPNNSALSLDCIREWVRVGKLRLSVEDRTDVTIRIVVVAP